MEVILKFTDDRGCTITDLRIVGEQETLFQLADSKAAGHGEYPIQLLEGSFYQYEVQNSEYEIEQLPSITKRFLVGSDDLDRGDLKPGLYVGNLRLSLLQNKTRVGFANLTVQSKKITYREDYRRMLDDIANISLDLLISMFSPTSLDLAWDTTKDTESLQQRFFFLRALCDDVDFKAALQQIFNRPHSRLQRSSELQSSARQLRGGSEISRQIASRSPRGRLSSDHPLSEKIPTFPQHLMAASVMETNDTQENRFVAFVIVQFLEALTSIRDKLSAKNEKSALFAQREVDPAIEQMQNYLEHSLFRNLTRLSVIPIGSPVLQRKSGYREVLASWLKFHAAGSLNWSGSADISRAGSRNVAVLYEYWIFFVLLQAIEPWIGQKNKKFYANLLSDSTNGFGINIKSGQVLSLPDMAAVHGGRSFNLQFSYNRTFSDSNGSTVNRRLEYTDTDIADSWTRRMRPDFTLTIWPISLTQDEALRAGSIKHLHFDAKYSVNKIKEIFGGSDFNLDSEKMRQKSGNYTRGDLLKMHAYKDAIRRSTGAYIIYPGHGNGDRHHLWQQYHEVIPGLGAFSINPNARKTGAATIRNFIMDVLDECLADTDFDE